MGVSSSIYCSIERIIDGRLCVEYQHVVDVKPQVETYIRKVSPVYISIQTTVVITRMIGHVAIAEGNAILFYHNAVA